MKKRYERGRGEYTRGKLGGTNSGNEKYPRVLRKRPQLGGKGGEAHRSWLAPPRKTVPTSVALAGPHDGTGTTTFQGDEQKRKVVSSQREETSTVHDSASSRGRLPVMYDRVAWMRSRKIEQSVKCKVPSGESDQSQAEGGPGKIESGNQSPGRRPERNHSRSGGRGVPGSPRRVGTSRNEKPAGRGQGRRGKAWSALGPASWQWAIEKRTAGKSQR